MDRSYNLSNKDEAFNSQGPKKSYSQNSGSSRNVKDKGDFHAFYESGLLSGLFINIEFLSTNENFKFDTVYLIFLILHEICHIIRFNYGAKQNHSKCSPLLDIKAHKLTQNGEIGEIMETLIAVNIYMITQL